VLGVSALHDALINFVPVRSVYVLEHWYVLFALAMTHHLFGRVARIDAELSRRTQELQESLLDLRRTETELAHKEQLAAVGELSAIIVQEVRSPISLIGSALTALHREHDTAANRTAMLDVVDQQSDRLSNLVGDLLTYAKPLHAQITRTPVTQLIERALHTVAPSVRERTVIDIRIASTPDSLECDPDLLHQALHNLLDDSLPTADTDRRITIETTACDHRGAAGMRLSIASRTEPGDATQRLSGPTTSVRRPATGLGLAIADRVVRAHQGHLEIRSSTAEAITIVLTLPLHVEGTAPVTPSQFPPAAAAAAAAAATTLHA